LCTRTVTQQGSGTNSCKGTTSETQGGSHFGYQPSPSIDGIDTNSTCGEAGTYGITAESKVVWQSKIVREGKVARCLERKQSTTRFRYQEDFVKKEVKSKVNYREVFVKSKVNYEEVFVKEKVTIEKV
jgi:hypothetical protein